METAPVIIFVGLLVFLAHFFVALFDKTRVPDVLYLILIGIIIGPILQIISPQDFGKVGHIFTTIALVVILFEGGLELSIESLRVSIRSAMIITVMSFILAWIVLTPIIYFMLKLPLDLSLFIGAVLAGPAPAVVIPLVRQLQMSSSTRTTLMLESPIGEALCIIVSLAILESMSYKEVQVGRVIGKLLSSFLFAVIIGSIGGYFWSILLHRMRQLRYAIFTTPSFLFILYGLAEFLGFSGPVTALIFGITLGNAGVKEIPWLANKFKLTPLVHNETERLFFGEIVFLIKTFFFVYLGLSIHFGDSLTILSALFLSGVLLFIRMISIRISTNKNMTTIDEGVLMGIMIPKGTAAAVLASIPFQIGLANGYIVQNLIYSVVVISILLTSVIIFLIEKTTFLKLFQSLFIGYQSTTGPPVEK